MDVDYFEKLWRQKVNKGSYKEGSKASWDSRVEEFIGAEPDERIGKITELLLEKKMLHENSSVLDIGCGPGKFAVEFARRAKTVVGLDISPKMLHNANENVVTAGLKNTEFKELDWETTDLTTLKWKKKFSLVTAIMSPALNSKESLDKIIEASSEYGFLCHFVERHNSIQDELKKRILGEKSEVDAYGNKGIYCSFNILWQYHLFPELVYFKTNREHTRPLEEAHRHYISRLEAKEILTMEQKTDIMQFLNNIAENGAVTEKITGRIACVYWKNC